MGDDDHLDVGVILGQEIRHEPADHAGLVAGGDDDGHRRGVDRDGVHVDRHGHEAEGRHRKDEPEDRDGEDRCGEARRQEGQVEHDGPTPQVRERREAEVPREGPDHEGEDRGRVGYDEDQDDEVADAADADGAQGVPQS